MMANSWRYLGVGAAVVAVLTVAPWATKRVQACGGIGLFSINCDGIIIANQLVQIGHMVSQITSMANQLRSMDGVLSMTTEFVNSDDPAMGNLGRVRDMLDRQWAMAKDGTGLSTDAAGIGAYLQRIPGVTDVGAWLDAIAPASTALLGTRPATATGAELAGAFAAWARRMRARTSTYSGRSRTWATGRGAIAGCGRTWSAPGRSRRCSRRQSSTV